MKRKLAVMSLLVAGSCLLAHASDQPPAPTSPVELRVELEKILKETHTPGLAVALVSRDRPEWVAGIGLADVVANRPVTSKTLFRIGSVSKGFAALAALKLQEEGRLKLTDTVKQWAPDVVFANPWEATDPVRLVHLMEHTAGFDDIRFSELAHNDPTPVTLQGALDYRPSSRVSRWRPGTRMAYCNSGPAVLAAVIEKVTGQRFEDYVRENFFVPLRMTTASYFLTPDVERGLAVLYHGDGVSTHPYWHVIFRPAGSINASAEDMANYVRFHLGRGSLDGIRLLQPESIDRAETPQSTPAARLGVFGGYGLHNDVICADGFVYHGHNGGMPGALAEMRYLREHGRGYAIMINSNNGGTLWRISRLLRGYLTRDLTPPTRPAAVSVSAELQTRYRGYYQGISPRVQWIYFLDRLKTLRRVDIDADGIGITPIGGGGTERFVAVSERLFRRDSEPIATLALLPETEGPIQIQTPDQTFKQVSGLRAWGQLAAVIFVQIGLSSSLVFALVWGTRKLFGKLRSPGPLAVRVVPLLSAVLFYGFLFALAYGSAGPPARLGTPTWVSVGMTLGTITFAVTAVAGLFVVYRARTAAMNRIAYWHSVLVAIAAALAAGYFAYWGVIGLRTWS